MTSRAATEWRYEKLTWPEINETIEMRKVCIIPCGAVEQHGPHLPLDVDLMCPGGIARGVGESMRDKVLVLPTIAYGYTGHVMDFPGTINTHWETFIKQVLDVTKSLAYHGFKKIILLNGHGSNMPNLDLAARTNLETDAECVLIAWWNLLTVDKTFAELAKANSPAAARTLVSWRLRCICTSTKTACARTRSRAARSNSTTKTTRSTGSISSEPGRDR